MSYKGTILIVDDDREILDTLGGFLESEGYIVKTAENGNQAMEVIARLSDRISMITLDIQMPEMHGLEFLHQVRKVNRRVPIVMVSSKAGLKNDYEIMRSNQVKHFLTKPYDIDELLKKVSEVLTEHPPKPMSKIIMVGDEEAQTRKFVETTLEEKGMLTVQVKSRASILRKLKYYSDVVAALILEVELIEGEDKWKTINEEITFLEKISEVNDEVPVILTSKYDRGENFVGRVRHLQVVKFLPKPLKEESLVSAVLSL